MWFSGEMTYPAIRVGSVIASYPLDFPLEQFNHFIIHY